MGFLFIVTRANFVSTAVKKGLMTTSLYSVPTMAGPQGIDILRFLGHYRRDPWQAIKDVVGQYGDPSWIRVGPYGLCVVHHPLYARQILEMDTLSYGKAERYHQETKAVVGQGLATVVSANLDRRYMIEQCLAQQIAHLSQEIADLCRPTFVLLDEQAKNKASFDLRPELFRLNLRILGRVLLGLESETHIQQMAETLAIIRAISSRQFNALLPVPANWSTPQNRRFQTASQSLRQLVAAAMADPQAKKPNFGSTIRAQRQNPFTEKQLEDEILSLLFAGCEDPPNSVAWALALLSLNPGPAEKLQQELNRLPDLITAPYLRAVVQESWRLYPPTWGLLRDLTRPAELGIYPLRPGEMIFLALFLTHRHPDFWPEPEKFEPERFLPPHDLARHPYAFLPFGAGTRACVAQHFAAPQTALMLAQISKRYQFQLAQPQLPRPEATHTLRPQGGLWGTLLRR